MAEENFREAFCNRSKGKKGRHLLQSTTKKHKQKLMDFHVDSNATDTYP